MNRQQLVLLAWAAGVFGLAIRAFAGGLLGTTGPPAIQVRRHLVDVNRAGVHELTVLPGIGSTRAEAIVLERIRNGPFRSLEDLARVDGIGPTTLAALAPATSFGPAPAAADSR